mmetsp:Transcript_10921/g.20036  ORF Transcript_10921/g.20036 Transcript_10921/m.20036 type:complete len:1029 (+) Transcript_10921:121-3207(+)|eukprot:CAMPEP_0197539482 /NCGR_PEP_ID=MMETSP1318-20131121/62881_1 /TAXON_ID=552666 /ORGANISM="Partenskyella glossopodia, Strain RCC365" /LENGTH=1028 /DNA_ID=CAMNT_0043098207 /DNA_START=71 /DNA_END=3157 /DNA_ORIENTATION=-
MLRINPQLLDPSCLSSDEDEVRIPQKRGSYVRPSLMIPKLTREDIKVGPRGSNRLRRSHHLVMNHVDVVKKNKKLIFEHEKLFRRNKNNKRQSFKGYKDEGNPKYYTPDAIKQRKNLFRSPVINGQVNQIWSILRKNKDGLLGKREYIKFHGLMGKALNPNFNPLTATIEAHSDWKRDQELECAVSLDFQEKKGDNVNLNQKSIYAEVFSQLDKKLKKRVSIKSLDPSLVPQAKRSSFLHRSPKSSIDSKAFRPRASIMMQKRSSVLPMRRSSILTPKNKTLPRVAPNLELTPMIKRAVSIPSPTRVRSKIKGCRSIPSPTSPLAKRSFEWAPVSQKRESSKNESSKQDTSQLPLSPMSSTLRSNRVVAKSTSRKAITIPTGQLSSHARRPATARTRKPRIGSSTSRSKKDPSKSPRRSRSPKLRARTPPARQRSVLRAPKKVFKSKSIDNPSGRGTRNRNSSIGSNGKPATSRGARSKKKSTLRESKVQQQQGMDYKKLHRSLFELADQWTDDIDELIYAGFLFRLYNRITVPIKETNKHCASKTKVYLRTMRTVTPFNESNELYVKLTEEEKKIIHGQASTYFHENDHKKKPQPQKPPKAKKVTFEAVIRPAFLEIVQTGKLLEGGKKKDLLGAIRECSELMGNPLVDLKTQDTTMHIAAVHGFYEAIGPLHLNGVSIDRKNSKGETPIQSVVKRIVELLKEGDCTSDLFQKLIKVVGTLKSHGAHAKQIDEDGELRMLVKASIVNGRDTKDLLRKVMHALGLHLDMAPSRSTMPPAFMGKDRLSGIRYSQVLEGIQNGKGDLGSRKNKARAGSQRGSSSLNPRLAMMWAIEKGKGRKSLKRISGLQKSTDTGPGRSGILFAIQRGSRRSTLRKTTTQPASRQNSVLARESVLMSIRKRSTTRLAQFKDSRRTGMPSKKSSVLHETNLDLNGTPLGISGQRQGRKHRSARSTHTNGALPARTSVLYTISKGNALALLKESKPHTKKKKTHRREGSDYQARAKALFAIRNGVKLHSRSTKSNLPSVG